MTDKTDRSDSSLLSDYIENIAALQNSIQELSVEINQLRRDARADGFNMEAVHTLAQIVAKSPHDGGLGLLQDIVKYAHEIGLELEAVTVDEVERERNETDPAENGKDASPSLYRAVRTPIDSRLVYLFQLGLGLGVAWMFLSFL